MRYAIVIANADANYSAYAPDLPGCIATGATVDEVEGRFGMPSSSTLKACAKTVYRFHIRPVLFGTSI
jgi:hypothetical protein